MEKFFKDLINMLGLKMGMPGVAMDDENQCSLPIGGYLVLIRHLAGINRILLSTSVYQLEDENRQKIYAELLKGQYFFQRTMGSSLSVDVEEQFVALQILLNTGTLTQVEFLDTVEKFVEAAEYWHDKCQQIMVGKSAKTESEPDLLFSSNTFLKI